MKSQNRKCIKATRSHIASDNKQAFAHATSITCSQCTWRTLTLVLH